MGVGGHGVLCFGTSPPASPPSSSTLQSSVVFCCIVSGVLVVLSGEEQGGRSLHYLIPRLLSRHVKMGLPWDGTSHKRVLEVPVIPRAARVESTWFEKSLLCCVCIRERQGEGSCAGPGTRSALPGRMLSVLASAPPQPWTGWESVTENWAGHALALGFVWPVIKGGRDTDVLLVLTDSIVGGLRSRCAKQACCPLA